MSVTSLDFESVYACHLLTNSTISFALSRVISATVDSIVDFPPSLFHEGA
jgi:hypothetical protein